MTDFGLLVSLLAFAVVVICMLVDIVRMLEGR